MNHGRNIFDFLELRGIPSHVSDSAKGELENLESVTADIDSEQIDFAFIYWPELDGLLHRVGNQSPEVPVKLRQYEQWIKRLLAAAQAHYQEVRLYVFSDHGMANCHELLDLRSRIESLHARMARDYVVVYDSTMARFWFFNERARHEISECLRQVPQGHIMPDDELKELRAFFPDRYFGELIFLVQEGVLIVPSHMGERPLRAMHGYHPRERHSYAALLTNQPELSADIVAIPDLFRLMTREAERARSGNRSRDRAPDVNPMGSRSQDFDGSHTGMVTGSHPANGARTSVRRNVG
jgi:predicted AlkP superfamily pyrophosphatase or phosphodiesterase